jgi:hypothetical protein
VNANILTSRNHRFKIRRDDEDSLWYIEDRQTGKVVSMHGVPLGFIESSEAEDWIATHEVPGWGARKATT